MTETPKRGGAIHTATDGMTEMIDIQRRGTMTTEGDGIIETTRIERGADTATIVTGTAVAAHIEKQQGAKNDRRCRLCLVPRHRLLRSKI